MNFFHDQITPDVELGWVPRGDKVFIKSICPNHIEFRNNCLVSIFKFNWTTFGSPSELLFMGKAVILIMKLDKHMLCFVQMCLSFEAN